jgi:hypothetical protein
VPADSKWIEQTGARELMNVEITEEQRQAILLALAKLSLTRSGWHSHCLTPIAELLHGKEMYETFRSHGPIPLSEACAGCVAAPKTTALIASLRPARPVPGQTTLTPSVLPVYENRQRP